jgi:hypothetical protein
VERESRPTYVGLTESDQEFITGRVRQFCEKNG